MRLPFATDAWVWGLLPAAVVFIAVGIGRNYQTDLWHHLARGRLILAEERLVDDDRFSCPVPGRPFQDSNWGWQVGMCGLYRLGGLELVQAVNAITAGATLALLTLLCRRRGAPPIIAAAVGVFVFFGLWQQVLLIRPQTASFLLFVLLALVLEASVQRPAWLVLAPLVLAVWVNCHGGFPVGLAFVGAYVLAALLQGGTLGQRLRRAAPWLLGLTGCVLATLVNPYGWHVYEYVLHTSGTAAARGIDEWLPPSTGSLVGWVWVASLLSLLLLFPLSGRRPALRDLCVLAVFLPPACGAVRMVAWWLLVIAPILALQLAAVWPRRQPDPDHPTVGSAVGCLALLTAMVLSLPWLERFNPLFVAQPARAHRTESDLQVVCDHIRNERPGCIFTRFAWGEYLGWELAPRQRVFLDGRIELYPDEVWEEYKAVVRGRADWNDILRHYDIEWLVLDTGAYHAVLLRLVQASDHWRPRPEFGQGDVVVFERVR